MQEAFREHHGLQCGFCTPGMIMAAVDIVNRKGGDLDEHDDPRGARGQHLPLHGLPQHRRGRARRRRRHGQHARRPPNSRTGTPRNGNDRTRRIRENAMSATGIGAPVRRKEDQRFITGKGQYTDDINRPGQTYAVFVRSPHAHANIKTHRHVGGAEGAGRARRLHRRRHRRGQGRRPDLRLDDPLQGRLADEGGRRIRRWRRARCATSATTSPSSSPRRWRRRKRRGRAGHGRLRGAAGRRRRRRPRRTPAQPQVHDEAPNNTVYDWHLGDKAAVDAAFASAKHVTKIDLVNNRLIPNAMEPRAAIGDYDTGNESLHALHHQPEPARRAPGAVGLHRHRARAQAARDRARRRRRLRLQDLHLRRGDGVPVGRRRRSAGP